MHRQKKQRGWRRRIRELDRWAARHANLDPASLSAGYHSAEVWFERWPRPLPASVRRLIVQHLVGIHDRWLVRLSELGKPFYLGIWILEPGLTESQVVAAIGGRAVEYRDRHDPAKRCPPPARYHRQPRDLDRFEWTCHPSTDREWLSSLAPADRADALRHATRVERRDGDVELTFEREDWLGSLRARPG